MSENSIDIDPLAIDQTVALIHDGELWTAVHSASDQVGRGATESRALQALARELQSFENTTTGDPR